MITDTKSFLNEILDVTDDTDELILYRGQGKDFPLLPCIARSSPKKNTVSLEKEMLEQLKRRSKTVLTKQFSDDWEWLVYAQHYGMHTRLLDWTTNPLVALWFAAKDALLLGSDAYVYVFIVDDDEMILDKSQFKNPFDINITKVFRPELNNERIIAQSGWFTAHRYAKTNRWVPIGENRTMSHNLVGVSIPNKNLVKVLRSLNILGINQQSLFPDMIGVCKYINWLAENNKLNH